MAQIICQSLALGYEGTQVISDLSFEVNRGDYLSIVGTNGSGKSTLIYALLGLKAPDKGSIRFGDNLTRRGIGYLPQTTQLRREFPASVREVVMSGIRTGGRVYFNRADRITADENMKLMGITELADKPFSELSGGQRQRVLLSRALCATDSLLLLDEPVAGLDPIATAQLYELIESINKNGVTIVTVSHDLSAAMRYSTHILHLAHDFCFFGSKERYIESNIGKSYLGDCE